MLSRFTAFVLALVMGVPLCWCCKAATPVAAAKEETCSMCRYAETGAGQDLASTAPADSQSDRRCCAKFNLRTLSPDVAAAPRLVLVDLQARVWMRSELLPPPTWRELAAREASVPRGPPWHGPPLYQRVCALLI